LRDEFHTSDRRSLHAPLLLKLIHSSVPPHLGSASVHSGQQRRLILPDSDPERLRVVGNLRHDAQIGPFRRQPRHWSDFIPAVMRPQKDP
jgi:hypothetical protein